MDARTLLSVGVATQQDAIGIRQRVPYRARLRETGEALIFCDAARKIERCKPPALPSQARPVRFDSFIQIDSDRSNESLLFIRRALESLFGGVGRRISRR